MHSPIQSGYPETHSGIRNIIKPLPAWLFLTLVLSSFVLAQEWVTLPARVDTVLVLGNKKTHTEVIIREIPFHLPDTLDKEDLQLIQKRLLNLYLFKRVDLSLLRWDNKNTLFINVSEYWYIFPLPLFFINERDWNKLSYGFQFLHINFRGRNEKLSVGGWLGYNPAFFINYFNPWIGRKSRFLFGFSLFTKKIANKIFDFDESHIGGQITIGKRINLNVSLQALLELKRVHLPEDFKFFSITGTGTDLVHRVGLNFLADYRDLYEYPLSGYFLQWRLTRTGFTQKQPSFWRWEFDNRIYLKLTRRLTIGARNLLKVNRGYLPIYDRIYIGFSERIRGYFNYVFTGQNLIIQNVEVRIPLLPMRFFSWKKAPLPLSLTKDLKFGINLGLFADSGIVWNRSRQFALRRFFSGYGIGLHFQLPYINLLRIDHAWNDRGQPEWIVDGVVSF